MSVKPLSGFLMGICAAAGASASTCTPGYFDPLNGSNCQPAPVGSYVSTAGASAATLAPAGFYVDTMGATHATPAPLGSYAAGTGNSFATLAPPGTFVGVTGASAPTPAPVGYFVNTMGAVQATPAPAGYFVGATGRTSAVAAPLGFYVATTGASAPTPVANGFYTATLAATEGIGAGLMASPLNMAIDATQGILSAQKGLLASPTQSLDVAVSARRSSVDTTGLSAQNDLDMNSTTVVLQHTLDASPQALKFFGGLAQHKLKPTTAGSGQARTWLLGASRGLDWGQAEPLVASIYAGQSSADMVRTITELPTAETQTHSASLRVMGLRLSAGFPVQMLSAKLLVETGLVRFTQNALSENGTTVGTVGGLQVDKYAQWAAPIFVGLQHQLGALNLQWGLRADLTPKRQLNASLNTGADYSFAVPVALSSSQAWVAKLSLKEMPLGQGITLTGGAEIEAGSKVSHQQLQMVLAKRW